MKAKKIIRVGLRNPALRRIRKSFRDIISLAVKQKSSRLHAISLEYWKISRGIKDPTKKESLEQKEIELMKESNKLDSSLSKSIIQCAMNGRCSSLSGEIKLGLEPKDKSSNLDMVWIPFLGAWFCTKCCESLVEGDKILRKEKHPDYVRQLQERDIL